MHKSIDWQAIAAPLDVRNIYSPQLTIQRWLSWQQTSHGVRFECELAGGGRVDYRVDVIQPEVVRLRWRPAQAPGASAPQPPTSEPPSPETQTPEAQTPHSDMLVAGEFAPASFAIGEQPDGLTLSTGRIRLDFPRRWQLSAASQDEPRRVFFSERTDDRSYGPGFEVAPSGYDENPGGRLTARLSLAVQPGEAFYGLGEKFTSLDKWGQEHRLWAADCGNVSSYRSYKNIPLLLSSAGYGLFVHSSYPMVFKLGSESNITASLHLDHDEFDAFLIYGPALKHILARYAGLTGRAPVPPKWSFGFWISRAGYRSRAQVEGVVAEMRARGFPCDVINIDPWWQGEAPWCSYQWDTQAFPNPAEMIARLRAQGVRTCLWIHPYLPVGTPLYAEAERAGYLVRSAAGAPAPVLESFSGEALAAVDFTNPQAAAWWQDKLAALMDQGVAVFKTDFGEQAPLDAVYADGRSGLEMHNLYPLLYNRTAFELSRQRNGRGLVWGRAAYAGSQRYPVQWGGDSYASLDQLASQLRGLLSYGLSGVPFCSHDVGGFDYSPHFFDGSQDVDFQASYDPAQQRDYPKDPVVYARWLQVGVFSSHVRAHGKQAREPWTYGKEVEAIARRYLELRYRLLPYIYAQAVQAAQSGLPMVRPMALEYQDDPATRRLDTQYMFGSDLLVAPALRPDGAVEVYLPAGEWVDFWSKQVCQGPRWLQLSAPLDTLPLWVRGGAILPLGPAQDYVDQKLLDPLTVEIYAPAASGELTLPDEDRPALGVSYTRAGGRLAVRFTGISLRPDLGRVEVVVYGCRAAAASCAGQALPLQSVPGGFKTAAAARLRPNGSPAAWLSEIIFELAK